MIVFGPRAAAILDALLRSRRDTRPFLLPANVCPIVPETFVAAGQPFELVDIAEPWLEMDAAQCLERANEIAGVLFVRTYGSERDPSPFFRALRDANAELFLIDDKCLCRPDVDGAQVSPLADVTLFSTGYAKYVDLGGGGFAHLKEGVASRGASRAPDDYFERVIEGAREAEAQKESLNAIYARAIPAEVQLPPELQQWRFNIRVPEADRLVASAFAAGLFASRHYAAPAGYPVAAKLHADIVNLFNDRYFDAERARRMTDVVLRHLDAVR